MDFLNEGIPAIVAHLTGPSGVVYLLVMIIAGLLWDRRSLKKDLEKLQTEINARLRETETRSFELLSRTSELQRNRGRGVGGDD